MPSNDHQETLRVQGWLSAFGGNTFANDVRRWICRHPLPRAERGQPLPAIEAWLTGPITAGVPCIGGRHSVHLPAVGDTGPTVFDDHQFGDITTELTLAALSGQRVPPCLVTKAVIDGHHDQVRTMPTIDRSLITAWQRLLVARDWASPDATPLDHESRHELIRLITTPARWEPYRKAGFNPTQCQAFLKVGATFEQAEPWIRRGMTGRAAAEAAIAGGSPELDETAWAACGFSAPAARAWYSRLKCAPSIARVLSDLGVQPDQAEKATRAMTLPAYVEWATCAVDRKTIRAWATTGLTPAKAREWEKVGITPALYRAIGANLAQRSKSGTKPTEQDVLSAAATVSIEAVQQWRSVGLDESMLPQAIVSTATPETVAAWGEPPRECVSRSGPSPLGTFAEWLDLFASVDRDRYFAWRRHHVTGQWFTSARLHLLDTIIRCEAAGLGPEVFDDIPDEPHRFLIHGPRILFALVEQGASPDEAKGMISAGWLCDRSFAGRLVLSLWATRTTTLLTQWREDPTRPIEEVIEDAA